MQILRTIKLIAFAAALTALATVPARAEIDLLKNDRLIEAAKANDVRTGEALLNRNHNVDVREENDRTPLFIAAAQGSEDFVELLLRHKARVEVVDKFGNSPLYYAAAGNHVDVVEMLLEGGANVNRQNRRGLTPLMIAASEGHLATVQVLIEGKSDTVLTDFTGRTARDWAERGNRKHVLRYMKSAGIDR